VKLENVDKGLASESIKAVEALGLQFGAVDCVLDVDGSPWVIEVNTGPGLEGTAFKNYVGAFTSVINNILKPAKKAPVSKKTGPVVSAGNAPKTSPSKVKVDANKLRMLADMLDEADETEAAVVNKLAAKMFGN
jgi:hypothetical protein